MFFFEIVVTHHLTFSVVVVVGTLVLHYFRIPVRHYSSAHDLNPTYERQGTMDYGLHQPV